MMVSTRCSVADDDLGDVAAVLAPSSVAPVSVCLAAATAVARWRATTESRCPTVPWAPPSVDPTAGVLWPGEALRVPPGAAGALARTSARRFCEFSGVTVGAFSELVAREEAPVGSARVDMDDVRRGGGGPPPVPAGAAPSSPASVAVGGARGAKGGALSFSSAAGDGALAGLVCCGRGGGAVVLALSVIVVAGGALSLAPAGGAGGGGHCGPLCDHVVQGTTHAFGTQQKLRCTSLRTNARDSNTVRAYRLGGGAMDCDLSRICRPSCASFCRLEAPGLSLMLDCSALLSDLLPSIVGPFDVCALVGTVVMR